MKEGKRGRKKKQEERPAWEGKREKDRLTDKEGRNLLHKNIPTLSHEEAEEGHAGSWVVLKPESLTSDGMLPSSPGFP
jgi:hypothetical protein